MTISIIICTYNRCNSLADTLESLLKMASPEGIDYEILIVDNNSGDRTKPLVESFQPRFNCRLRYLFEGRQGKTNALNKGVNESIGELLIFTDDDVLVDPQWLVHLWDCYCKHRCDGIGGRIIPLYPDATPGWIRKNRDILAGPVVSHDLGESSMHYSAGMTSFVGANMAITRAVFKRYGLFRSDLGPGIKGVRGEDTEIFERMSAAGCNIYYAGTSLVLHKVEKERMNFAYVMTWFFNDGRSTARVERLHQKNTRLCAGIPRYILKRLILNLCAFPAALLGTRRFLQWLRAISVNYGQCIEYRRMRQCPT
jgi:glucosyl-dolichyl phosphate glucuronosyltransferase